MIILEPRNGFHGMILELKKDISEVMLKSGEMTANKHIREQYETMSLLRFKGYYSTFVFGFDQAKEIIDEYMK